jgi:hypothetical protein
MPALSTPLSTVRPDPAIASGGVFDVLESVFVSLCRGPSAPLVLPGRMFAPGRRRRVQLVEARELLLWPGLMDPDARDAALALLVRRAQTGDPTWVVGAAGVLTPALRRAADRLRAGYPGDRDDIDAEVLAGFLTALHTIDPDSGRLASRLGWAGYRAGLALRHRDTDATRRRAVGMEAAAPPRPWGHPDFVLAAAVTTGVITAAEAQLIGDTRLDGIRLEDAAAARGIRRNTLLARRSRAERRLVAGLNAGQVSTTAIPPGRRPDPAAPQLPVGGRAAGEPAGERAGGEKSAEESPRRPVITGPEIAVTGCRTTAEADRAESGPAATAGCGAVARACRPGGRSAAAGRR